MRILRNYSLCIIRLAMEPERINRIASMLADLQARSAELRRYL